jgi:dTDP-4-dehydrorhamnose reductase
MFPPMLRVLITGGNGLLAHALKEKAPKSIALHPFGHAEFDLQKPEQMKQRLDELRPAVLINTAAYNQVDRCEEERDLSWAVNALGPETLAHLCAERKIKLILYGTDYVFDGKQQLPYRETDLPNPLNHYAAGKFYGEQAVLKASPAHLVLRASWIFGPHPTQTKTYVHTVLKAARSGKDLKATTDQISIPTYAPELAEWTWSFMERGASGLLHAVNDGPISRYDWTCVILAEAHRAALLQREAKVEAVTTAYFNPAMKRPGYSAMDNTQATALLGKPLGTWRKGLTLMLREMKAGT